jgi:hypothetical protein
MKFDHLRGLFRDLTAEIESQFSTEWRHCEIHAHSTPSTIERAVRSANPSWVSRMRFWWFDRTHAVKCLICMNRDKIQETRRDREKLEADPDVHATLRDRSGI